MPVPVLIAGAAALAVALIAVGLAFSSREDPLRARLTQLGTMTARDLQELELQQPFFDRTIRPLAARFSGAVARITSTSFTERTERRLAMAGNPGDMRVSDWLGMKALASGAAFGVLFLVFGLIGGNLVAGIALGVAGLVGGYIIPEFWLGGRVRRRDLAEDPGCAARGDLVRDSAVHQVAEHGVQPAGGLVAGPAQVPVPLGPYLQHRGIVIGPHRRAGRRPQRRDGDRPGIVGVVLVHIADGQQPHPRSQLGLHIQHPLTRGDQLLGQQVP